MTWECNCLGFGGEWICFYVFSVHIAERTATCNQTGAHTSPLVNREHTTYSIWKHTQTAGGSCGGGG